MSANPISPHSALADLQYRDGILVWGGKKVTDIASELGNTPFYAYDRDRITRRVNDLRAMMPDRLHFHYAMKANPMPEVVKHMVGLVHGLDVASGGELVTALATGVSPKDVSFAGPGKRDPELKAAIESEITINIESEGELGRILQISETLGKRPNIAVRVNPSFELKSAGMKMGGRPSQFGIDAERVPNLLKSLESLDVNFRGLHIFSGSQNLRSEAIVESLEKTVELVLELMRSTKLKSDFINLGGGLGIPYFPKESSIALDQVAPAAQAAVDRLNTELGDVETIMELGRFFVGESGIYVVRVIDIKESRGVRFAICDGGLHHHLSASGNFGQVIRKNYPVASVRLGESTEEVTVVGPLCTPLDLLGDRVTIGPVEEGSLIALMQSGAYGRTASPEQFLSHPPCAEIIL